MKVLPMRRGFTVRELLLLLLVVGVAAALVFPIFYRAKNSARNSSCQGILKQLGIGFVLYTQDYNDRLPRVIFHNSAFGGGSSPAYGWADGIRPYLNPMPHFQCPSEPSEGSPFEDPPRQNFTDYYMNRNLSGAVLNKIEDPAIVILCGEGNDGTDNTDARYALKGIPSHWLRDKTSPAYRHGTGNYLFAAGNVRSLSPQRISTTRTRFSTGATFAPQIMR